MKAKLFVAVLVPVALGLSLTVDAADRLQDRERVHQTDQAQTKTEVKKQEVIYGSQLMTPKERREFRAKMHSLKSAEEREALRHQHHEEMQARAKAMGKTLPDEPPARGTGMGTGGGMGRGMGPGGGMGPARP